ncbi:MAG: hypothetical protein ABI670_23110 [Chloroflexota bacterium]
MNLEHIIPNSIVSDETLREKREALILRALFVARVGWPIYVALLVSMLIAAFQVRYLSMTNPGEAVLQSLHTLNMSTSFYAFYFLAFELFFTLGFIIVAAIIYARNSDDWIGVFSAYALVTFGVSSSPLAVTLNSLEDANPLWAIPVRFLTFAGWSMLILFFYLFPDGRFLPSKARWTALLTILLLQIPWNIFRESPLSPWQWPAEWHIVALLVTWVPAWAAQFYRYRRNTDIVKAQQTKWFVYGSIVAVISAFGFHIPRVINPALNDAGVPGSLQFQIMSAALVYSGALLVPIGIGISILRYRLWDIDIIINKTLVYIPLTGILAGLYAASIRIFQGFFETLLGTQTDIAVIMTTLVLAATFTPIKNALQTAVDKRFKGPPDPSEQLEELVGEMRLFVEMNSADKITRRVMEDVVDAFDAEGGAVYMKRGSEEKLIHTYGDWQEPSTAITAPVECEGVNFGTIKLSNRKNGDPYGAQDQDTLRDVVGLLACTLQLGKQ